MLIYRLGIVGLAFFLFACTDQNTAENIAHSKFEPMTGWVLVSNGSIDEIKASIMDYDSIATEVSPKVFSVELHEQKDGTVAVLFPEGLPSYDMANITAWLDAPPNQENVYGAKSWVVSPDGSVKYFLKPEAENRWGDTLIGSSKDGISIRVFLPETGVSEISQDVEYAIEPSFSLDAKSVSFVITLDTEIFWANPKFSVNKAVNHVWRN